MIRIAFAVMLLALPAKADEKPPYIEGLVESSSASGSFEYRPGIIGHFITRDYEPAVTLNYHLWTLTGELVWGFRARTSPFSRIELYSEEGYLKLLSIGVDGSLPHGTVRPLNDEMVLVSNDLMNKAYVYNFVFLAVNDRFSVFRRHQGISAPPEQWGWSVPGSPDWEEAFTYKTEISRPFDKDDLESGKIDGEKARSIIKALLAAKPGDPNYYHRGFDRLEITDLHVRMGDLIHAIWREDPDILRKLRQIPDSPTEQRIAGAMMKVAEKMRSEPETFRPREMTEISNLLYHHGDKLSDELKTFWEQLIDETQQHRNADRNQEVLVRLGQSLMADLLEGKTDHSDHQDILDELEYRHERENQTIASSLRLDSIRSVIALGEQEGDDIQGPSLSLTAYCYDKNRNRVKC
ncbi:MAG: hypothetical protein ACQETX_08570 [Pseudomonadota bacterium]